MALKISSHEWVQVGPSVGCSDNVCLALPVWVGDTDSRRFAVSLLTLVKSLKGLGAHDIRVDGTGSNHSPHWISVSEGIAQSLNIHGANTVSAPVAIGRFIESMACRVR